MSSVNLVDWSICGDFVKLIYSDFDFFYIPLIVFNRAFGPIVSSDKDSIIRDFAIFRF